MYNFFLLLCTLPYSANQTSAPPTPPGPHKYNFNIFHQSHLYRNNRWNKDHSHLLFIITSTGSASHPQKSSPNSSLFHAPTLSWISRSPLYLKFHAPTLDLHVPSLHTFMHLPSPGPPGSHSVQDAPTLDLQVPTLYKMPLPWTSRFPLCTRCPYPGPPGSHSVQDAPTLDLQVPTLYKMPLPWISRFPLCTRCPYPGSPCSHSVHMHAPTLSGTSRSPEYMKIHAPTLDLQVPTLHTFMPLPSPGLPGPHLSQIHVPTLS